MASINGRLLGLLNRTCNEAFSAAIDHCERRGVARLDLAPVIDQLLRADGADVAMMLDFAGLDRGRLADDLERALRTDVAKRGSFEGLSTELIEMVRESWLLASVHFGEGRIRGGHLLLEMLDDPHLAHRLTDLSAELGKLDAALLLERFAHVTDGSVEENLSQRQGAPDDGERPAVEPGGALHRFGHDLTAAARAGETDPVIGRDDEIREMVTSLMRRRQNNPILVGEAGVGKTAVVEGLARRIASGEVPPALQGASLVALDIGLLQAGASMKGEFEQRLKQVIEEVQGAERLVILFIDEAHTLIGAGGSQGTGDAANLLKPALARGTLRTVAATTLAEYKVHIEPDPALVRRFQTVRIDEPGEATAIRMMRAVAPAMEAHHGAPVTDAAVRASVELSHRYIPSRQLPDKSISLLDTAAARVAVSRHAVPAALERERNRVVALEAEIAACAGEADECGEDGAAERRSALATERDAGREEIARLERRWDEEKALVERVDAAEGEARETVLGELRAVQGEAPLVFAEVDRQAVAAVVEDWTGIPVGRVLASEMSTLLELGSRLGERVIGQDHALETVAENIRTARAGLNRESRPTGVFMFAGTSGVGKTESAKALAELLYGGEQKLVTISMSEFKTAETVTTLKGPPPGYVGNERGGILTEAVKRNPYSVVLLDEIEKAHPDVNELFFRLFDEGILEDSNGVVVDFRNTVIILTTNAGTDIVMQACEGGAARPPVETIATLMQPVLEATFSPAFMGRVQVVPFYPLGMDALDGIARLQLGRVAARLERNRDIELEWSDALVEALVARCSNAEAGGRAIDAILNRTLLPRIGRELLQRSAAGERVRRIVLGVDEEGGFDVAFDPDTAP